MEEELRKHMMNNSKTSDYQNQNKKTNNHILIINLASNNLSVLYVFYLY